MPEDEDINEELKTDLITFGTAISKVSISDGKIKTTRVDPSDFWESSIEEENN